MNKQIGFYDYFLSHKVFWLFREKNRASRNRLVCPALRKRADFFCPPDFEIEPLTRIQRAISFSSCPPAESILMSQFLLRATESSSSGWFFALLWVALSLSLHVTGPCHWRGEKEVGDTATETAKISDNWFCHIHFLRPENMFLFFFFSNRLSHRGVKPALCCVEKQGWPWIFKHSFTQ